MEFENLSLLTKILDINSEYLGIEKILLMENAGREVAREAENFNSIAIFSGLGNNGGDGFVAARHLTALGKKVKVFAISGKRTKEAQKNFELLKNLPSVKIFEIRDSSEIEKIKTEVEDCDAVIDALIGIGIKGELKEPIKTLTLLINSLKAFKISVDVPTPGIKADVVVSFHIPKTEKAKVVSIGIPKEAEIFVGPGDVFATIPERSGNEHKGDFGKVLVIGGSKNFIGTPMLVAQAALRIGIDLVKITCPKYVAEKAKLFDPNIIINPLNSEKFITLEDIDLLLKEVIENDFNVIVIGNGIGTEKETKLALKKFLRELNGEITMEKREKIRIVLDADAIKLIEPRILNENIIITPHIKEFRKLFSIEEDTFDFKNLKKIVEDSAKKFSFPTIVLKGRIDIISNGKKTKLNRTGNPGMTVGGTGDVLSGIIGGLAALNSNIFNAASSGTFLCGLAGDLAKEEFGYSLIATDVIEKIPEAIKFCKSFLQ